MPAGKPNSPVRLVRVHEQADYSLTYKPGDERFRIWSHPMGREPICEPLAVFVRVPVRCVTVKNASGRKVGAMLFTGRIMEFTDDTTTVECGRS